ncbi:hypothetical protein GCM10011512_26950 [Tersicoccus solisilvae]|uniref:DUF5666 domain-containing protein n=1 Tax=Tersicoccus solisilvae TaxID=1882339 RepID=A0ABQ1PKG0_9MICC|nr:hypothetical protein [Tersicoccus solisilvae]GGC98638.1 hypothetical protein GCM10011512_26950 [Tersicoccus solisilvae]
MSEHDPYQPYQPRDARPADPHPAAADHASDGAPDLRPAADHDGASHPAGGTAALPQTPPAASEYRQTRRPGSEPGGTGYNAQSAPAAQRPGDTDPRTTWGAPPAATSARPWTLKKSLLAAGVAVGVALGGGAAAVAASSATSGQTGGPGGAGEGFGGQGRGGFSGSGQTGLGGAAAGASSELGSALHGQFVAQRDGSAVTLLLQTGTVTAVTSSSLTVKSTDGYSATYAIGDSTRITGVTTTGAAADGQDSQDGAQVPGGMPPGAPAQQDGGSSGQSDQSGGTSLSADDLTTGATVTVVATSASSGAATATSIRVTSATASSQTQSSQSQSDQNQSDQSQSDQSQSDESENGAPGSTSDASDDLTS